MANPEFDIERIKNVLREATKPGAPFSQRSLAKEAGEGRDTVGDIINGRNKNPTTKVLSNLAGALDGDLSMFGLSEARGDLPTEAELRAALADAMPNMPKRGTMDRRVEYLAANVARILRLPLNQPPIRPEPPKSEDGEGAPPPPTTN